MQVGNTNLSHQYLLTDLYIFVSMDTWGKKERKNKKKKEKNVILAFNLFEYSEYSNACVLIDGSSMDE